ncbi:MAG: hypothetical protein IJ730_00790 [Alphaproteobacteria bacterium]|nr:hypothetical protein [Alphaproteobacteria bacterium]
MLNFSRVETYRRTITYGVDVHDDYDFLKKKYSPKNILDRITPETEYGRKLKKDLLRELSFTLSQSGASSSSSASSSSGN